MKQLQSTPPAITSRSPMDRITRFGCRSILALVAAVVLPGTLLRADTIILKSGTGTLPVEGTIVSIDSSELVYTSASTDRQTHKPIDNVLQIKAANEPKLTAAEQAYADGKWSDAVTNYQAPLNSSSADWVKNRAMIRLIDAAAQSKQFAPQVSAFIELAKRDPANARAHRPDVKGIKADQINAVVGDVEQREQLKFEEGVGRPAQGVSCRPLPGYRRHRKSIQGVGRRPRRCPRQWAVVIRRLAQHLLPLQAELLRT